MFILQLRVPLGPHNVRARVLRTVALSLAACSLLLATASTASGQWTITNLHPAGATHSTVQGGSGAFQVGEATVGNVESASLWSGSAASRVNLNPTGSSQSAATGVSGTRQSGWARFGTQQRAGVWSGTASSWTDLNPATALESDASDILGNQQVGRANIVASGYHASLWSGSAASWVDLQPAGALESAAWGTSGAQQVGGAEVGGITRASLWTGSAASWVDLSPPGATFSNALGVFSGQQVGVVQSAGATRASLWTGTAGSLVDLHPAGAIYSIAYGTNGSQQVGVAEFGTGTHAAIWSGTAASWMDLHSFLPAGFTSSVAKRIWNHMSSTYIVGDGYNGATGRVEALMWVSSAVHVAFCPGDGTGTACPCANNSAAGSNEGCLNSLATGGKLVGTGNASISSDTVTLLGSQMPNSSALYFQGTTQLNVGAGLVFGDGKRCAGGSVVRLKPVNNSGGASQYPQAGDPSVSAKGLVTLPGTRTYQVWYRNAAVFCTSSTFNLTNGVELIWGP